MYTLWNGLVNTAPLHRQAFRQTASASWRLPRWLLWPSQYVNPVVPHLQALLPGVSIKAVTFENAIPGEVRPDLQITAEDMEALQETEILITDSYVIGHLLYKLPKLKWIQASSAGLDPLTNFLKKDVLEARGPPGCILTRFTGDSFASFMFEYCFCFIVNYERGFLKQIALKSTHSWSHLKSLAPANYRMVDELTIAILGTGSIGSRLANAFRKHGSRTVGYARRERTAAEVEKLGLDSYSTDLESVLSAADYIVSILPHTPATAGLLNGKFSCCKKKPVFINLGRGSVVQTDYLLQSLDQGLVAHAVLDVFEQEPLPDTSPLWAHERVTITPHVSCQTRPQVVAGVFAENYRLFTANMTMKHVFDWEQLY